MKVNFEKCAFYFMLIAVSGSIGYAIKPEPPKEQISYEQQNDACVRATTMMAMISKTHYKPKTKKEWAIERMMRN